MKTTTKKGGTMGFRQAAVVLAFLGASSVMANTPGSASLSASEAIPVEEIVLVSKTERQASGTEQGENCLGDLLGGLTGSLLLGSLLGGF
ncbi:hypothetical protein [Stigmatella aurantiaca]|uniref:Uncharacterized protein n=1 Tax=Stigmatella aurantiaca (strain DW4/3-1) TaxID=378806 RepID=E3FKJ8_STIAD|nr:hypothetical protein [Stigmatella aurantiaca]ADO67971.1 uncharacterized protein STAUR_0162 [Stigmatella aurantiaca DW4/3-1]